VAFLFSKSTIGSKMAADFSPLHHSLTCNLPQRTVYKILIRTFWK